MEKIQIIMSITLTGIGIMCTVLMYLKKVIKNKKIKEVIEVVEEITKQIIPYMEEAERYINYEGREKKEYVMTKMNKYAIGKGIEIEEEEEEISKKIEELIELTKKVNKKEEIDEGSRETIKKIEREDNEIKEAIRKMMKGKE